MEDTMKARGIWQKAAIRCAVVIAAAWSGIAAAEPMLFVMQVFPPFVMDERSESEGAFPEMVRAVCAIMKTDCRTEIYPWRRALRMAEEGDAHGILVIQKLPEREQRFHMTPPIVHSSYVVFAREESHIAYSSPHDLDGYTIGVYGPSATSQTADSIAKAVPTAKIVLEVDNATVLRKLSALRYGEKAVAVMNADVGKYLILSQGITGLAVAGEIRKIEYYIGLSRRRFSDRQAEQFNAALQELGKSGVIKAIASKYGLRLVVH